ncbi:GNAT family N-acetyltransferase [Oxalobacteraceae bacterium]|nr:GNAT family N-acetyltransferase [Oxalobacteraceae bacterium]
MDHITLRPATEQDQAFLLALYTGTRTDLDALPDAGLRAQLIQMQFLAQQQHYRAQFPQAEVSIVLAGGRAVGRIVVDRGAAGLRLVDISLLPGERGQGIGRRLLTALMEQAQLDALPVCLNVLTDNPARHLYQRLGFVPGAVDGVHQSMEWRASAAPLSTS